jgi:hypothetical protein
MRMFSLKEREIIKRCVSVSICNYRIEKIRLLGKDDEVAAFRDRLRKEITLLMELTRECSADRETEQFRDVLIRKNDGFIKRCYHKLFGRAK